MTEMPRSKRAKAMDEGDRISSLPDELRRHVLSFLPARDAVRTSVLAPKWRHLWASARRLNVDAKGFSSQSSFVNDTVCLWICHALRSNVEELSVIDHDCNDISERVEYTEFFRLQHYPLTSSYLKKLHLCYVYISNRFLKTLFSGCPALEDLEMINCDIFYTDFTSATLKSLSIDYVHFPNPSIYDDLDYDIVINMPSLVSLHIGALLGGAALSLVDMQSLATASIYLDAFTYSDGCTILSALSNVKKLELLFPHGVHQEYHQLQGSHNMQLQVAFANLTSLSLSDWCLIDNCKALLYLLEHAPKLEQFTLVMTKLHHRDDHHWFHNASAVESPCKEIAAALKCESLRKLKLSAQRVINQSARL